MLRLSGFQGTQKGVIFESLVGHKVNLLKSGFLFSCGFRVPIDPLRGCCAIESLVGRGDCHNFGGFSGWPLYLAVTRPNNRRIPPYIGVKKAPTEFGTDTGRADSFRPGGVCYNFNYHGEITPT